nr:MAG TPA: tRNA-splicing ligase RtcB [Caudoviricetes sp.]
MKDLKIFTSNIEQKALDQINLLMEQDVYKDCKVRIMPDVHAGAGCVIGFTANLGDKITPNLIGVDIGCGMTWYNTGLKEIDFEKLDNFIRTNIPSGMNVNETEYTVPVDIEDLYCYKQLKNSDRYLQKSLCSLGGGNHFIEIDKAKNGDLYIVIHSGSRNLGKQVCEIYQEKAIKNCSFEKEMEEERKQIIADLKSKGESTKIEQALIDLKNKYKGKTKLPKDLCYIEGQDRDDYLHDMKLCQSWATFNRYYMLGHICLFLGIAFNQSEVNETIHNYIDDKNMARKGAIRANKDEIVLIPINMRDGCIIGRGKGNEEWNCSAPHGAGRIMSRNEAREKFKLENYAKTMDGIYTTSVCEETIDEAPMAYKPMQEIIDNIKDTVDILEIIKPVFNFKAKE